MSRSRGHRFNTPPGLLGGALGLFGGGALRQYSLEAEPLLPPRMTYAIKNVVGGIAVGAIAGHGLGAIAEEVLTLGMQSEPAEWAAPVGGVLGGLAGTIRGLRGPQTQPEQPPVAQTR